MLKNLISVPLLSNTDLKDLTQSDPKLLAYRNPQAPDKARGSP